MRLIGRRGGAENLSPEDQGLEPCGPFSCNAAKYKFVSWGCYVIYLACSQGLLFRPALPCFPPTASRTMKRTRILGNQDEEQDNSGDDRPPLKKPQAKSIREALARPIPTLDMTKQSSASVTTNPNYVQLNGPSDLKDWDDFTYKVLSPAFSDLLEQEDEFDECKVNSQEKQVTNEDSFQHLASKCCASTLYKPLKTGATKLAQILGYEENHIQSIFFHQFGGSIKSDHGTLLKPDWFIDLTKINPERHIVVGETKCTTQWRIDDWPAEQAQDDDWMWPWRQIATYCQSIESRYGFILVPEGLIATLMYEDQDDSGLPLRIKYKLVPWGANGENKMTVNLSLFFLAMMAMHDGHRPIVTEDKVLPLNIWWKNEDEEGMTYEHHLSGRVVDTLPKGAQARTRPTAPLKDLVPARPLRERRSERNQRK